MVDKIQEWKGGVKTMFGMVCKHPQASYTGVQKFLQQEWALLQCATQGLGEDFWQVEKALQKEFLQSLFLREEAHLLGRPIMEFTVKHAGLAIPYPNPTAQGN